MEADRLATSINQSDIRLLCGHIKQ